jgi:GAF domain-containing protein
VTGLVVVVLVVLVIWVVSLAIYKPELPRLTPTLDPEQILAGLRSTINDGDWSLDTVLQCIAETAQMVTGADGAAIALRRDDVVICQARAGEMAPELGTKLDTSSGISGQCLRTGWALRCDDANNDTRVDAEVCRSLGLRSLAVVPVGRRPEVSGVLEAFSAVPSAFRNSQAEFRHSQVELLQQLAELVIVAQRRSAESAAHAARGKVWKATVPTLTGLLRKARGLVSRQAKALLAPGAVELVESLAGVPVLALLGWVVFRRLLLLL